ncbi:MAG: glucose-1-phosphate cytidylyltransferase [Candidatus Pelagibacterales bacterium]|nr:MAG: glucose-1-phosphate cytidylyltransferase [Pelagibacterales bacterium]|tara:strand:+ start:2617 stop:3318 length:702 start_codon:yes stop_codon:yes gene_type:complete
MKVIILAGGLGTRLAEYTHSVPKPMVEIGGEPILSHIMRIFKSYNFNEFIIAAGYKNEVISKYYKNSNEFKNLKIIDTGQDTMTGGRILRLKSLISEDENFFMTYGDGLCNVNLDKLKEFHLKNNKIATITAVHPPVRFGELEIEDIKVKKFEEKSQAKAGWINGGFFILNYKIFSYIKNDSTLFEREPMERLTQKENLVAFKHEGFWKCMDNLRDKIILDELCKNNNLLWKK